MPNRDEGFSPSTIAIALVLAVVVFIGGGYVLNFVFGWTDTAAHTVSAENVRDQWSFAYRYTESLNAAARQACTAERLVTGATDHDEHVQRTTQLAAIEANYARIQAEYDARLRNAFEARLVRPHDVPERAPELNALKQRFCPAAPTAQPAH